VIKDIASALLVASVSFWLNTAHADNLTVKIGSSQPLTGGGAVAGKDAENGLRLAIDELNEKNLVINGKKVGFVLQSEDDQADPRIGVQVAQKLSDSGVNAVIGPFYSGVFLAAASVYKEADVPLLTDATNPAVTHQGLSKLFQVTPNDSRLGGEMAKYAVTLKNIKTAAIIDDRTAYGGGVADEFEKVAKQSGLKIVDREYTNDKATDFKAILTKISAAMPDVIFFGGYSQQAGLMVKQMHSLGIKSILFGGDAICNPDTGSIGGKDSESIRCPIGGAPLDAGTASAKFGQSFLVKYKAKPQIYSAVWYDAMNMLAQAMVKAQSTQAGPVSEALHTMHYKGIIGDYEFTDTGELKAPTITIYEFVNGDLRPVVR
jgi:branched-chain amino acid transport system substrate-binding protein